ncbi:MAG TPA: hypothetical protein VH678_20475 [Xanthobacteraceae bacterium]|jgi:hypothetical protein
MSYRPIQPFKPYPAATQALAVTGSSASVALPANSTQVMLTTKSTDSLCFFEFGSNGVTAVAPSGATLGGTPLNGGTTQLFSVPIGATYIAAITATGAATLYITAAEGL